MPGNSTIFKKANQLMREGYPRKQAFAVAYSELGEPRKAAGKRVRKNPVRPLRAVKRKTRATTMVKAKAYVRRPSQATRQPPSKRLKVRRTKNLRVPVGVFPNPTPKKNVVFVMKAPPASERWSYVGYFLTVKDAKDYARAYHIANPNFRIKVESGRI